MFASVLRVLTDLEIRSGIPVVFGIDPVCGLELETSVDSQSAPEWKSGSVSYPIVVLSPVAESGFYPVVVSGPEIRSVEPRQNRLESTYGADSGSVVAFGLVTGLLL